MKRILSLMLALIMLVALSACGKAPAPAPVTPTPAPVVTTPAPTPKPTPEPTTPAKTIATHVPLIGRYLNRGEAVKVVGEQDSFYSVLIGDVAMLVEKRLVRLNGEASFERKPGYATENVAYYDNYKLRGNIIGTLTYNQEISLLEDLGTCYLAELEGKQIFVNKSSISLNQNQGYYGWGGDYSGGGDGGGGGAPSGGVDGADIPVSDLSAPVNEEVPLVLLAASYPTEGTVLCDKAEAVIAFLNRGEAVGVLIDEGTGMSQILWNGQKAVVESRFIRLDSLPAPEAKTVYTKSGATCFETWELAGNGTALNQNTKLTVLEDFGDCLLVQLEGGILAYIDSEFVSDTEILANYYYGGDYSGGDSGGGGGGGDVWTEPTL